MSSGTSVPIPRTSRTMGPRLTVSIQTVARSTVGAAGLSWLKRHPAAETVAAAISRYTVRRIILLRVTPARFTSIPLPHLLLPQRAHGIHTTRPPGGNEASNQRHHPQQGRDGNIYNEVD